MASRFPSRLLIITHALINHLIRRRPQIPPKRILIAHHLFLGDTLTLTPLLAKARALYPEAEIIMAAPQAIAPIYQKRPYGVEVFPYNPRNFSGLPLLLQQKPFDLAIAPGDNRVSWLCAAMGARHINAFEGDRPAYKNWLVDEHIPFRKSPAAWSDMLADLIPGPAPEHYSTEDWPDPDCSTFEKPKSEYCILHVGASSPLKMWPPEYWQQLTEFISKQGLEVVWSGGPGEERYVDEIDPEQRHKSYAGKLDMPQLWHLIKGARLLVCPDTGVAHLARIIGTPAVALFGPGSTTLSGPGEFWEQSNFICVTSDNISCRDQDKLFKRNIPWLKRCVRSPEECPYQAKCMTSISPSQVIEAIIATGKLQAHNSGSYKTTAQ